MWNVRSLLESEGPVQTASTRHQVADDKKMYRIIQIFKRLGLEIVCLQETCHLRICSDVRQQANCQGTVLCGLASDFATDGHRKVYSVG